MSLPKPGQSHDVTFRVAEGVVRVEWTTPKFKAWRALKGLIATRDAFYMHQPGRAAAAADAVNEAALMAGRVRAFDVPAEILDIEGYEGGPVDAPTLIESCGSADLITAIAEDILRAGGLSSLEKKASSAPRASSSTGAAAPATGSTTPSPSSGGNEGADPEG